MYKFNDLQGNRFGNFPVVYGKWVERDVFHIVDAVMRQEKEGEP